MSARILKTDQNGLITSEGWDKTQNPRAGDSSAASQWEDLSGVNTIIAIHTSALEDEITGTLSLAVYVTTHQKWIEDIAFTEF